MSGVAAPRTPFLITREGVAITNAELLAAAAGGEQGAWDALVERYGGLVWHVARGFRLSAADTHDVVQTAWLRLVEYLDRIRDPQALAGWLATTVRRECLRVLRTQGRSRPTDDSELDLRDEGPEIDAAVLAAERDHALWRAFATLRERCRTLLLLLMADPPPAYAEIGDTLGMPIGSIGPTRARCLEQLRTAVEAAGITGPHARSGEL